MFTRHNPQKPTRPSWNLLSVVRLMHPLPSRIRRATPKACHGSCSESATPKRPQRRSVARRRNHPRTLFAGGACSVVQDVRPLQQPWFPRSRPAVPILAVAVHTFSMEEARAQGTRFASIVISLPNESCPPEQFSISRLQCFPKTTGLEAATDSRIESRPPILEKQQHDLDRLPVSPFVVALTPAPPVSRKRAHHCLAVRSPTSRQLLLRPRSLATAFQSLARHGEHREPPRRL